MADNISAVALQEQWNESAQWEQSIDELFAEMERERYRIASHQIEHVQTALDCGYALPNGYDLRVRG